jgi:hypothetical protein
LKAKTNLNLFLNIFKKQKQIYSNLFSKKVIDWHILLALAMAFF